MPGHPSDETGSQVIATIENRQNPNQRIDLVYLPNENGFSTDGIRKHFDLPEILIPAHLIAQDMHLMGAIVSTILERVSLACEGDAAFEYASRFQVMDREFTLVPRGDRVVLETAGSPEWLEGREDGRPA